MLTNRTKKLIKSLQINKYRYLEQRFLVEGTKNVLELLQTDWQVELLLYTSGFADRLKGMRLPTNLEHYEVKPSELQPLGSLKTNDGALAVVAMIPKKEFVWDRKEIVIGLNHIQDPGNLGTIFRISDWYGVNHVVCSEDCVEPYNPKVVNASMGSFFRVNFYIEDLPEIIKSQAVPVYALTLGGKNLHGFRIDQSGMLLFGNESKGLPGDLVHLASQELTIPRFGAAESLNVGVAVAVVLDNLRRN